MRDRTPRGRAAGRLLVVTALLALAVILHSQSPPPHADAPAGRLSPAPIGAPLSPRNANYSIDVQLDPTRHLLTGQEVITWRNISNVTTPDIRLHLYYNAWKNTRSTWLRELRLAGDNEELFDRPEADWAYSEITALRQLGAGDAPPIDLTSRIRPIAPDDRNPDDQTLISVALPSAVAPGATINLEVAWTARIPRTFARTGVVGNYFFLAQWFPKMGVLADHGWAAHQFHASTEFFADYGVYDVRLRVPSGWIVGATGVEAARRDNGDGTTTHTYQQQDVHDFAWTTSPDYREHWRRFEERGLPPVEMRLLVQPEHAAQVERHFAATAAALRYYGSWYGAYPYGHVTIVDPAFQSGAGGMEYPTLFTAGTSWLAPAGVTEPEAVTVHEAGHQFWYGIVGNNEFEDAWLDEGFTQFSEARATEAAGFPSHVEARFFGGVVPWVYRDMPLTRETDPYLLPSYRRRAEADVPATLSFRYFPSSAGAITYAKTALWLHTLERYLGWPTLQRILSTHFARWRFRHPRPADFFAIVNEVSGQDMTWFFDQVYRSSNTFDYAVDSLASEPSRSRGFVTKDGRPGFVDQDDTRFETRVVVRRLGEALFPVDVLVVFEDGSSERQRWDGQDRWKAYLFDRASRAVSAQVDPDRVLLLDVDRTNNSRTLAPRSSAAATKWSLVWLAWVQDLLLTWAFLV